MIFHRFIEDKSVKIFWCGHEIEAWNPFCSSESKTQEQPTEYINGDVKMKGYVLPHKNNFSTEKAYKNAGLGKALRYSSGEWTALVW